VLQRGGAAAKAAQGPVRQTEVQYRTLNPVWDETFVFSNVDLDATVVVTLYDFDLVGSHDFLGRVEVPIYTLPLDKSPPPFYRCPYPCPYCTLTPPLPSRAVDEWIALEARTEDDEVAGDVFLKACPSSPSYPSCPFYPSASSEPSSSSLLPLLSHLPLILLRMTTPPHPAPRRYTPSPRHRIRAAPESPPLCAAAPPPLPRTNRTSLVPPSVLTGQVSSLRADKARGGRAPARGAARRAHAGCGCR
jgi:hypothetical protein